MTRPDRQGPFALLVRNFFHGLFESDLLPENLDVRQPLIWMGVLLICPSGGTFFPAIFSTLRPHPRLLQLARQDGTAEQLLAQFEQESWGFELMFLLYAIAVIGFITVMVWDRAYPDRRDVMAVGVLPVRDRTVFAAKLTALLLLVVGSAVHGA